MVLNKIPLAANNNQTFTPAEEILPQDVDNLHNPRQVSHIPKQLN